MAQYPIGLDVVWVASDSSGHCAAFITLGAGPIPTQLLHSEIFDSIEDYISSLPIISSDTLAKDKAFSLLAEKGFYVYDWQNGYELVATPSHPIAEKNLSQELGSVAQEFKINGIFTSQLTQISVEQYFPCSKPD